MNVTWQVPYSPPGHPVLHYTLYINSTLFSTNITTEFKVLILKENEICECCNITFSVTASNDISESMHALVSTFLSKGIHMYA